MMKSEIEKILEATDLNPLLPRLKRKSEETLYRTLVACMQIAELALEKKSEAKSLDNLLKQLPKLPGTNRTYIFRKSDVYQRVCRLVFYGEEHKANIYRYVSALRVAAKNGVDSSCLLEELKNSGVSNLFHKRNINSDEVSIRWIRLDRQIRHKKSEKITITLLRKDDGTYEVIE